MANNRNTKRAAPWSVAKIAVPLVLLLGPLPSLVARAQVVEENEDWRIVADSRRHTGTVLEPIFDSDDSARIRDVAIVPYTYGDNFTCQVIQASLVNHKDQFNIFNSTGTATGATVSQATITLQSLNYIGFDHGNNPYFRVGATHKSATAEDSSFRNVKAGVYTLNAVFEASAGTPANDFTSTTCVPFTTTLALFTAQVQHGLASANGSRWSSGTVSAVVHTETPTIGTFVNVETAISIEESNSRYDTGIRLHQFYPDCPASKHEFDGPDLMEMAVMHPYDSTEGANSIQVTFSDGDVHTNFRAGEKEQHIRLYFTSSASFTAGARYTTTIRSYVMPDCDNSWSGVGEEDSEITVPAVSTEPYATYVHEFTIANRVSWVGMGKHTLTTAVSLNRSDTQTMRMDTGIRFHTSNEVCPNIRSWMFIQTTIDDPDLPREGRTPFRLIADNSLNAGIGAEKEVITLRMLAGDPNDRHAHLYTRTDAGSNNPGYNYAGVFSLSIQHYYATVTPGPLCSETRRKFAPLPRFITQTVAITIFDFWEDQGGFTATAAIDPPGGRDVFSPVRLATITSSQDLGVTIQLAQQRCRRANVSLAQSDYFELDKYDKVSGDYSAGGTIFTSVNMDDDHVRLRLRPGTSLRTSLTAAFTATATVGVSLGSADCTHVVLAGPTTYTYTMTVGAPAQWQALSGKNVSTASTVFHGPNLSLSIQYTGITVHYGSAAGCDVFDITMLNHTDILEMQKFDTSNDTIRDEAAGSSFVSVTMNTTSGDHLALRFRPYVPVFQGARTTQFITVSMALDYDKEGCTSAYDVPYPTVLTYPITINSWTEWEARAGHQPNLPSATYFAATMTTETDSGVRLQRSSLDCHRTDITLASLKHVFLLSLEMDDGSPGPFTGKTYSVRNVNMDPTSAGDGQRMKAALYFKASPNLGVGDHTLTIRYSAHSSCPARPDFVETFTMTFGAGDVPWTEDADEVTAPTGAFDTSDLVAGAVDTGVRVQRYAQGCDETAVRLIGDDEIFQLAQFSGSGSEVPGVNRGSEVTGVDMRSGVGGEDHHVRLFFREGHGDTQDKEYVVTLEARAGDGCSFNGRFAAPQAFALTLSVNDDYNSRPLMTNNQGLTRFTLVLRDRHESRETGLVITVVDDKDAEDGWPQMAIGGADAAAFELVTLSAHSQEYTRLVLSLRLADATQVDMTVKAEYAIEINAADHDDSGSAAPSLSDFQITVAQITLRDPVTEEAVRSIGGVAVRAIGLSGVDSVLSRAQVGGGDSRLAQRDGSGAAAFSDFVWANEEAIENGDFDLREFMTGQAFALPLGVGDGAFDSGLGIWGKVDLLDMSGGPASLAEAGDIKQEGEIFSAQFGVDALLGNGWLAGIGYGLHEVESTYQRRNNTANIDGTYKLDIDVVQPYVGFDALGGRLAAAAGFGSGDLTFTDDDVNTPAEEEFEAGYRSYALGYGRVVSEPGAADELSVRGAFVSSQLDIDGEVLDAESSTMRLALAYVRALDFGASQEVKPSLEVAYATSWGASDDDDGDGYEVIAGLGYALDRLEAEASYLYISTGGGTESKTSGAALSFRYSPLAGGLGLGFEASPAYGPTKGSDGALWEIAGATSLRKLLEADRRLALRTGIDYGLAVPGGVLTPYGRYDLIASGAARELGMRMDAGAHARWILSYRRAADETDALKIEYWLGE